MPDNSNALATPPNARRNAAAAGGGAAAMLAAATLLATPIIQQWEGHRNVGYLDPSHIPTSCWGHVGGVVVGHRYSDAECQATLTADLRAHAAPIVRCITVPVRAEVLGAMITFGYNAGPGVVCQRFAPLINAGHPEQACAKLSSYVFSRDRRTGRMVRLQGLANRRASERALCERGLR